METKLVSNTVLFFDIDKNYDKLMLHRDDG